MHIILILERHPCTDGWQAELPACLSSLVQGGDLNECGWHPQDEALAPYHNNLKCLEKFEFVP